MPTIGETAGLVSDDQLVARAQQGDVAAFNELLAKHNDLLQRKAAAFARAPIPNSVVHAQAIKLTKAAVTRYQPGQGAQFRTFLESNLRLTRFVNNSKNVARVPEHRALMIGRFLAAKQLLLSEKDREPSVVELAEALGWSVGDVQQMETAVSRRELAGSAMQFDQIGDHRDRFDETAEFLYYGLAPDEQLVYDYSLGRHGKPRLTSVAEMAKRTKLTTDRIYAIKRQLARRLSQAR